MAKPRRPRRSASTARAAQENSKGWLKIAGVVGLVAAVGAAYVVIARGTKSLDDVTLCPSQPTSITVLLVDVTDPMTTAQRQDFQNQLKRLRKSIPRYGKLVVTKVDSSSDQLLRPVIVRCNPGTASDVSDWNGNPQGVQKSHDDDFVAPLDLAFASLSNASAADRSPIFESMQSVTLTELSDPDLADIPKKVVLVSDLLQNTDAISFYAGLPAPNDLISSSSFRRVRTDLSNMDVEIWMLERLDANKTQPRALIDLWDAAIAAQGGTVERAYNVSG
jgi:hypothetical protein